MSNSAELGARESLWAEFERRKKEDRLQRRRHQRAESEVKQILADAQRARNTPNADTESISSFGCSTQPKTLPDHADVNGFASLNSSPASDALARPTPTRRLPFDPEWRTSSSTAGRPDLAALPISRRPPSNSPELSRCRGSSPPWRSRVVTPIPQRQLQLNAAEGPFGVDARDWAVGLRRRSLSMGGVRHVSNASEQQLAAYPGRGWDDRTACPSSFGTKSYDGFRWQSGSSTDIGSVGYKTSNSMHRRRAPKSAGALVHGHGNADPVGASFIQAPECVSDRPPRSPTAESNVDTENPEPASFAEEGSRHDVSDVFSASLPMSGNAGAENSEPDAQNC